MILKAIPSSLVDCPCQNITPENHHLNGGIPIAISTLTAKQRKFFSHARHMAEMSDFHRAPVGCIAVIGNKVVATGFSQQRTHPMQQHYNRYRDFDGQKNIIAKLHAEMVVVSQLKNKSIDFSKISIYIYRVCRSRDCGISRPCGACMMAIKNIGIKNVFYTTDFGYAHERIA